MYLLSSAKEIVEFNLILFILCCEFLLSICAAAAMINNEHYILLCTFLINSATKSRHTREIRSMLIIIFITLRLLVAFLYGLPFYFIIIIDSILGVR